MTKFTHLGTDRALTICSIAIFIVLLLPTQAFAQGGDTKIFIPLATSETSNEATGTGTDCALNAEEEQVALRLTNEGAQNRDKSRMVCNGILAKVARERAGDMARRGYFNHTNPDGLGPNYLVTAAGYKLPSFYNSDVNGNNIESIAAGYTTPEEVWSGWMNSEKHRSHLMAEKSFYADQVEYGIGYFYMPDSKYKHYWVVLTAYSAN